MQEYFCLSSIISVDFHSSFAREMRHKHLSVGQHEHYLQGICRSFISPTDSSKHRLTITGK